MKRTLGLLFGAALAGGALLGCAPVLTIGEVCGDGSVAGEEACDDGNTAAGDGCDAACAVEAGYACEGEPSACAPICGDGVRLGAEVCDGADLGGVDCLTVPGETYRGGTLACDTDCTFNTLACDPVEDCNNGGDEDEDGIYDCADAECVERPPCNSGNETVCDDADDQDGDGFIDCADATDCQGLAMCAPGAGPVGSPCQRPNECQANSNDPFCIDAAEFDSWTDGYCSEFCDLSAPDCPAGATCFDTGLAGQGLCLDTCEVASDCRSGYTCNQFGARKICWPGTEICDNGVDDENDGDIDCADSQCDTFFDCAECGDGTVSGSEQCDDGDLNPGDGCDGACKLEGMVEGEPNDICTQPEGPIAPEVVVVGSVGSADNIDMYAITVPQIADLRMRIFTEGYSCAAPIIFHGMTCGDYLGGSCEEMSPESNPAMRGMTPGTYYLEIPWYGYSDPTPYTLQITYDALCGNGVVEGTEQCDGGVGCTAACKVDSTCGDLVVEGTEQCDDGNTNGGDGCDTSCQIELKPESEPNNGCLQSDGPYTPEFIASGAIEASGAADWYAIALPPPGADLRIETFGAGGPGTCDGDTIIELLRGDGCGESLAWNDDYSNVCSRIDASQFPTVHNLPGGFYYVRVTGYGGSMPSYRLRVSTNTCGDGKQGGLEECDDGPSGSAGCTAACELITDCGDGVVEGNEQCDPPDIVTCNLACNVVYPPESQCSDFGDSDGDGLTDCEDPDGCKALPECVPGNTPAGGPCTTPSDCQADNSDPICISQTFFGWPGGYCSQFCDVAANDCPAGSTCSNLLFYFPSGAGTCMDSCATDADCNPGYFCYQNFCLY